MATLDDILTTQKNGVVALNNISQELTALQNRYSLVTGELRSATVTSRTEIAVGSGRLVSINIIVAGSAAGLIYDSRMPIITTATNNGTTSTITYVGQYNIANTDTVIISGNSIAAYNISTTVTGTGIGAIPNTFTFTFNLTPDPGDGTGGLLFNQKPANRIVSIPNSISIVPVGAPFTTGLVIEPGTGQALNVVYSLD
jgi:hypothetical protein